MFLKRRSAALLLISMAAEAVAGDLVLFRKIGTDWNPDAPRWMNFVAMRSDGSAVAGNGSGQVSFWSFPGGEHLRSVAAEPLAISANFRYLASESNILDLQTGIPLWQIPRREDRVMQAAFSPDGEYVALVGAGGAGQIAVLRAADGSAVASFGTRYTGAVAFHPDGRRLASGHFNNVTLWDVRTGARLALLMGPSRPVDPNGYQRDGRYICGIGFSRDGKLLAAGSDDGELQIWDGPARKLLHSLHIGYGFVSNPAFSPDGTLVAAGTYADGTLSLVEVASGQIRRQMQVSMFGCGSVAFSPDGQYLITPSNGGMIGRRMERGGTIRVFQLW